MTSSAVRVSDQRRFVMRVTADRDARAAHAVIRATDLKKADAIELVFHGGMTLTIPRGQIPAVTQVPLSKLANICVVPTGDALSWRPLDIDIDVHGWIRGLFQTR